MPNPMQMSGDILPAAIALAALIVVFLAALVAKYLSIPGLLRDTKTRAYYRR